MFEIDVLKNKQLQQSKRIMCEDVCGHFWKTVNLRPVPNKLKTKRSVSLKGNATSSFAQKTGVESQLGKGTVMIGF